MAISRAARLASPLLAVLLVAACQGKAPTTPSGSTPTAQPSTGAKASPGASGTGACAMPAPISSPMTRAAALDSYSAIAPLGYTSPAGELTPPTVTLTLAAYPGGEEVRLTQAKVAFEVKRADGVVETTPLTLPIAPVVLPAGAAGQYGPPVALTLRLPVGALRSVLKAGDEKATVTAKLEFVDYQGFVVLAGDAQNFQVKLPLALTGASAPAMPSAIGACPVAKTSPSVPYPTAVEGSDAKPTVVALMGMTPPEGVLYAGALAPSTVTARLAAPPGGGATTVKSYDVFYSWDTAAGKHMETEPKHVPLAAPLTLPEATFTAYGATKELAIALDAAAFAKDLSGTGQVTATVQLNGADDRPLLDANFQTFQLGVSIAVQ